jgi:hypothetical protein
MRFTLERTFMTDLNLVMRRNLSDYTDGPKRQGEIPTQRGARQPAEQSFLF